LVKLWNLFLILALFDEDSESDSKPNKKLTRATSKSTTLQGKNGLLDNGNK